MYLVSFDIDVKAVNFREVARHKDLHGSVEFMDYEIDFIRSRIFIRDRLKFKDWDTFVWIKTPEIFTISSFVRGSFEVDFASAMSDRRRTLYYLVPRVSEIIDAIAGIHMGRAETWNEVSRWLHNLNNILNKMLPNVANMTKRQYDVVTIAREAGDNRDVGEIIRDANLVYDRGYNFYEFTRNLITGPSEVTLDNLRDVLYKAPLRVVNINETEIKNPFKEVKRC